MKLPNTEEDITISHMVQALSNLRNNPGAFEAFFIGYGWIEGITYCSNPQTEYVKQTAIPAMLRRKPHMCLWLCRYFLNREEETVETRDLIKETETYEAGQRIDSIDGIFRGYVDYVKDGQVYFSAYQEVFVGERTFKIGEKP